MKMIATNWQATGLVVVAILFSAGVAGAQPTKDYPLGGASKPKPQMSLNVPRGQYKRIHQFAMRMIELDQLDRVEEFLGQHLEKSPADPESHYLMGVLKAYQGKSDEAVEWLAKAIERGLPAERVLVGPREYLSSLHGHERLAPLLAEVRQLPLHGPLVGNVTDDGASFWIRTAKAAQVAISVQEAGTDGPAIYGRGESIEEDDYTAVVRVVGLQPQTKYDYRVYVDGATSKEQPATQYFHTFPEPGAAARFKLAFGGGAGYVPENERMWNTIEQQGPLALLLLGDNVYIDDPESLLLNRYTFHRRQSRPEYRRLTSHTAVFAIWDDHDFSTNDSWGGADIEVPFWKRKHSWKVFQENWPNPGFGGGEAQPGCWYSFPIGDVDFIMLDCRYYRTDPRKPNPTMLGPVQMEWLKQELTRSRGTFKVICSSVPWDFRTKGDSRDTWNGFKEEREEIFSFIEKQRIEGVVLLSADRHRSDAWRIDRPDGYAFYEFNSSRLTNQHVHPTMEKAGAIFSYNKKQSFGLVTFDTTESDPLVTYDVFSIDGEKINSITVQRSQLTFPQ